MDKSEAPRPGWIVLICPAGAELAPISHGDRCYEPYGEDIHRHSRWLVEVPRDVAVHRCKIGGFYPLNPG